MRLHVVTIIYFDDGYVFKWITSLTSDVEFCSLLPPGCKLRRTVSARMRIRTLAHTTETASKVSRAIRLSKVRRKSRISTAIRDIARNRGIHFDPRRIRVRDHSYRCIAYARWHAVQWWIRWNEPRCRLSESFAGKSALVTHFLQQNSRFAAERSRSAITTDAPENCHGDRASARKSRRIEVKIVSSTSDWNTAMNVKRFYTFFIANTTMLSTFLSRFNWMRKYLI